MQPPAQPAASVAASLAGASAGAAPVDMSDIFGEDSEDDAKVPAEPDEQPAHQIQHGDSIAWRRRLNFVIDETFEKKT